ncbi:hypothetical protein HK104_003492, partial [Borealophlyctis nickersoniae]
NYVKQLGRGEVDTAGQEVEVTPPSGGAAPSNVAGGGNSGGKVAEGSSGSRELDPPLYHPPVSAVAAAAMERAIGSIEMGGSSGDLDEAAIAQAKKAH